ncbi:hypothetical protein ACLOJK_003154 [Asimina triloba]
MEDGSLAAEVRGRCLLVIAAPCLATPSIIMSLPSVATSPPLIDAAVSRGLLPPAASSCRSRTTRWLVAVWEEDEGSRTEMLLSIIHRSSLPFATRRKKISPAAMAASLGKKVEHRISVLRR